MSDLRRLDLSSAVGALRASRARGFLGLDPEVQNDALLAKELTRARAQLLQSGDTLLGAAVNPDQPRQARLDSSSDDPAAVVQLTEFLALYQRSTSFVAELPAGSPAVRAFAGCGFRQVGTLRGHLFHSGRYHDVLVYFARGEEICPS